MKKGLKLSLFFFSFLFVLLALYYAVRRQQKLPVASLKLESLRTHVDTDSQLRLLVVGDTGSGDTFQYKVAKAMEAYCLKLGGIDGLVMLGDNFYMKGVSSLDDPQWQEKLEIPYGGPCLSKSPIYPILGNHDYRGNISAQIEYSSKNERWHMPWRFYSVQFGSLLKLIAFDSSLPDFCFLNNHCAVDFLLDSLEMNTARWTMVNSHHPLSSASAQAHSHSGEGLFGFFMRKLVCGKADVWFSGHAHHMEHRELDSCKTSMFTVGSGGGDLKEVEDKDDASLFALSQHGFLDLELSQDELVYRFVDSDGKILYNYTKVK